MQKASALLPKKTIREEEEKRNKTNQMFDKTSSYQLSLVVRVFVQAPFSSSFFYISLPRERNSFFIHLSVLSSLSSSFHFVVVEKEKKSSEYIL